MDKRIVLAVLVGLLLVGWLWWSREDASVATPTASRPVAETVSPALAETGAARSEAPADRAPPPAEATAAAVRDADAEPTGELLVQVVWADEAPAPGIHVYLARSAPDVSQPLAELVTDAAGEARTKVSAGKVLVQSDRGGRVETEVVAGQQQQVRLQLGAGVDVLGTVRDPVGAPVPGALIWLTARQSVWRGGAFVTAADARGAFTLRAVPKEQSLGASAPGFLPSKLVDLDLLDTKQSPVKIELVLEGGGGALAGRVTDEQGKGVAGAIVAVGKPKMQIEGRANGTVEERWSPRRATTDDDGRYTIEGLVPGEQPVEVWGQLFPFWHGQCLIEARATARLDVTLLRGVTVHGVVTGEDGEPLAGAVVRAFPVAVRTTFLHTGRYDYESTFGHPFAVADAAGHYRLLRIAPGEVHLYAGAGGSRRPVEAWANEVLHGQPGAVLEWNPKIDPGLVIRGVVRYRDGVPIADVAVVLTEPGTPGHQVVANDKEGRFRFVRLQKRAYDVSVDVWTPKDAPPVGAREVWPDSGELEITAAFDSPKKGVNGSVRGAVSDAAGRLANASALAVLLASDHEWSKYGRLDGGAFRFTDIEPGRRRIVVMSGADPILFGPWFELQSAEDKDVGTLVTEPGGKLLLSIVRQPGTETIETDLYIRPVGASPARKVTMPHGITELVIDNLCAGEQEISAHAMGMASILGRKCTIVAGAEARAKIELRAAVLRELVVEYTAAQKVTNIRVMDDRGDEHFEYRPQSVLERPYRRKVQMPLGRFTFFVETEGGGKAETEFEMTSLAEGQGPVVLKAK